MGKKKTPAQHAIRTFWGVFLGLVLTMGAMRRGIWALHSVVMTQMKALQPSVILKAGEGKVQRKQLWKLLETAKTVYASKDCFPAECLSLIVLMFLFVGFVEGGVVLASVVSKNGDVQESFAQSPELFVSTFGTVVPLAFFIMHAAHPLVVCNDKLKTCKNELKMVERDFEKMKTMWSDDKVSSSIDAGFEAAVRLVEKELSELRAVTFFGIPYSRGSRLVIILVIPACHLGGAIFQVLKLAQQGR